MYRRGARNNHVVLPGFGVSRHNTSHCRAQSTLSAVSRNRATDAPACGKADTDGRVSTPRILSLNRLAGRGNGLKNQSWHGRFAARGRGMEKFGPPRQADDPGNHRPIQRGVRALWRGAAQVCGGRRRFSYGREIRADVCARYCWAERFASMSYLRQISSAGPKLRCERKCLLWKSPLNTNMAG